MPEGLAGLGGAPSSSHSHRSMCSGTHDLGASEASVIVSPEALAPALDEGRVPVVGPVDQSRVRRGQSEQRLERLALPPAQKGSHELDHGVLARRLAERDDAPCAALGERFRQEGRRIDHHAIGLARWDRRRPLANAVSAFGVTASGVANARRPRPHASVAASATRAREPRSADPHRTTW